MSWVNLQFNRRHVYEERDFGNFWRVSREILTNAYWMIADRRSVAGASPDGRRGCFYSALPASPGRRLPLRAADDRKHRHRRGRDAGNLPGPAAARRRATTRRAARWRRSCTESPAIWCCRRLDRRPGAEMEITEECAGPEDLLEDLTRRESIEQVRQAVLSLPPVFREVVVLCDLQDSSYEEAAAALDCPVGTVRSRLSRGRAMLARKLRGAAVV